MGWDFIYVQPAGILLSHPESVNTVSTKLYKLGLFRSSPLCGTNYQTKIAAGLGVLRSRLSMQGSLGR